MIIPRQNSYFELDITELTKLFDEYKFTINLKNRWYVADVGNANWITNPSLWRTEMHQKLRKGITKDNLEDALILACYDGEIPQGLYLVSGHK